jgi:hypothetical protein
MNAYRFLVQTLEEKIPLRRHTRRWEDNINVELKEIGCGVTGWIYLAQGPVEGCFKHCNEPPDSIIC